MPDHEFTRNHIRPCKPEIRRLLHYTVKAIVGSGKVEMRVWRCEICEVDFHMDNTPNCCPHCGVIFNGEAKFGEHREKHPV